MNLGIQLSKFYASLGQCSTLKSTEIIKLLATLKSSKFAPVIMTLTQCTIHGAEMLLGSNFIPIKERLARHFESRVQIVPLFFRVHRPFRGLKAYIPIASTSNLLS